MTPARQYKNDVYEQFARVGKALSSPRRIELLDVLCQGPRTVEVLAAQTAMTVANASQHLQALRAARLVTADKEGLYVRYRVADPEVEAFYLQLRRLAERRLAEVEAATRAFQATRTGPGGAERVEADELLRRALAGEVTVLDIRPGEEFEAGHLPRARSVPLRELEAAMATLPADREVVAYCRGPYCVFAVEAVERLRARGFVAHRLEEGPIEFRARGIPLEGRA